jgi:hypothetical protein
LANGRQCDWGATGDREPLSALNSTKNYTSVGGVFCLVLRIGNCCRHWACCRRDPHDSAVVFVVAATLDIIVVDARMRARSKPTWDQAHTPPLTELYTRVLDEAGRSPQRSLANRRKSIRCSSCRRWSCRRTTGPHPISATRTPSATRSPTLWLKSSSR